jgi:hypothetical protein
LAVPGRRFRVRETEHGKIMKGIISLLSIALLCMALGGVIGIRESASLTFHPEWYTPTISVLYTVLNAAAMFALVRSAQEWDEKALMFFGLVAGWFSPAMVVGFDDVSEWMPHVVWGLMLLVPPAILLDLLLRKRASQLSAYKH